MLQFMDVAFACWLWLHDMYRSRVIADMSTWVQKVATANSVCGIAGALASCILYKITRGFMVRRVCELCFQVCVDFIACSLHVTRPVPAGLVVTRPGAALHIGLHLDLQCSSALSNLFLVNTSASSA